MAEGSRQTEAGDYVFIQFGHNDEKPKPDRHTDPGSTFDANLRRFVEETRQKGGIPVLFNSVVRRCWYAENLKNDDDEKLRKTVFDGEEKINSDTLIDTHGAYVVAPRCVAQELNVPFVDATKITHDIETSLGIKGAAACICGISRARFPVFLRAVWTIPTIMFMARAS